MERESKPPPQLAAELNGGGGGMFVKVMTDEQIEVLRKQIAVYAAICQNLVDLHKSLTAHNDLTAGARFGNLYCDSLFKSGTPRIAGRQRWSPTPTQLHILERIFDEGTGAPNKLKIKEIARDLSQHGHISETNVYNWFQNRRARSKRKQQAAPAGTDAESGIETTVVSPRETKTKEEFQQQQQANSSSVHAVDPSSTNELEPVLPVEGSSKLDGSFEQMSFYGSALPNSRMEQILGKMEASGGYNPYLQQDDYHRRLDDDC